MKIHNILHYLFKNAIKLKPLSLIITFLLFMFLCFILMTNTKNSPHKLGSYKASLVKELMVIDGEMNEQSWNNVEERSLEYIYNATQKSDKQKTTVRILWDSTYIYAFFKADDKYLTTRETKKDGTPYLDDCAEIFLIPVPKPLDTHFCFEVNLNNAVNDIIFFNNYYQGQNIGFKPYDSNIIVKSKSMGTVNDNSDIDIGWQIEMAIPIESFGFLKNFSPVKTGNKWLFLALRQDRNEIVGERRITSTLFPIYDISKDSHQPQHFGFLEFVE